MSHINRVGLYIIRQSVSLPSRHDDATQIASFHARYRSRFSAEQSGCVASLGRECVDFDDVGSLCASRHSPFRSTDVASMSNG